MSDIEYSVIISDVIKSFDCNGKNVKIFFSDAFSSIANALSIEQCISRRIIGTKPLSFSLKQWGHSLFI